VGFVKPGSHIGRGIEWGVAMTLNNGARHLPGAGEGVVPQWHGVYPAVVVANNDPLGRGAMQLSVPMVSGTTVTDWAPPLVPYTTLPTPNQAVQCMFLGGDVQHPVWLWNEKITPGNVGSVTTTYSVDEPASPNVGDIWFPVVSTGGAQTYGNPSVWTFDPGTSTFSWVPQGSLQGGAIAPGSIQTTQLGNNAVTQGQIATGAVGTPQIQNGAVATGQIQTAAVTTYAIQNQAVAGNNIALAAVDTQHLAIGAVTAANIEAGTIVAGIIDGTDIEAATFLGFNFIINSSGAFWYTNGVL
jgi:hypothetical protein